MVYTYLYRFMLLLKKIPFGRNTNELKVLKHDKFEIRSTQRTEHEWERPVLP